MRFSYYKTANCTAPCGVVWYSALLLVVRCGYAILRAVLVQFLWFMRFGEHSYLHLSTALLIKKFSVSTKQANLKQTLNTTNQHPHQSINANVV